MPNVNLAPIDAQQAAINRKRALVQALQQASLEPLQSPPIAGAKISPWEGVSKLVQALSGTIGNNQLDKQQAALTGQQNQNRLAQALSLSGMALLQAQGLPAAMAQPQEAQIPGDNAVPAMPSAPIAIQLPVGPGQVQGRNSAVSALAQAMASTDPQTAEFGKMLLQKITTSDLQERQQAGEMARQLASQNFSAGQTQVVQGGENQRQNKALAAQQEMNAADIASKEKIAGMKQPPEKNPGYRDVEANGRVTREYFDQNDPSTVTFSKDIGPMIPHGSAETAGERALNSSSQHYIDALSKDFTPITASLQKMAQGQALMAANNPGANSLVAPTILEALVSGQGTGFRMTQPEIDAVNKGQGKIGNFQNWLSSWNADPEKYTALNADQKKWLNGVLDIAKKKAEAKVEIYKNATDSILAGKTPKDHQAAYRDALTNWSAIDSGAKVTSSTSKPSNVIKFDAQGNIIK